jgi:hypothetical protein
MEYLPLLSRIKFFEESIEKKYEALIERIKRNNFRKPFFISFY